MSFTDQKPFVVTEKHTKGMWGGGRNGIFFRCYLCGHKFVVGDIARWVYSNGVPGASGNPIVCAACDGPSEDVIARWKFMHEEAATRFWWFTKPDQP